MFSRKYLFFLFIISNTLFAQNLLVSTPKFNNQELYELLEEAQNSSKNKKFKKAIKIYEETLRIASNEGLIDQECHIYKKIGLIYYKLKKFEESSLNFKKGIRKNSLSKNAADLYLNLSLIHRKLKNQDSIIYFLKKSLSIYETKEFSKEKFETYLKAGILFMNAAKYNESIKYLLIAYDGFEKLENNKKKATVCDVIGDNQRLLNNHKIARKYYLEGLKLRKEIGDSIAISDSYNSIGNIYKELKIYDSAIFHYHKAIEIKTCINNDRELGRMLNNLASVHYLNKSPKIAYETYLKALKQKYKEKDTLSLLYTFNELALIKIELKDYEMAKEFLDSAEIYKDGIEYNDAFLRNLKINSLYYKSIKDFRRALQFHEEYNNLYQIVFNEKQSKEIQKLQEEFENARKEKRISELSKSENFNKVIIRNQKENIRKKDYFLAVFGLIITVLIVLYFLLKQQHKIKRKTFELDKLEAIFKEQERLKGHISKDLHDIIATGYEGIRLKVIALAKSKDPVSISKQISEEIKDINHQIRLISHRLSPLVNKIKNAKLSEIIISQLSETQYYSKIFIDLSLPLPKQIDQMKIASQTNFYGILLEIFNNIEKHSKATNAKIIHSVDVDNNLNFIISDNGIGFKMNKKEGIGIANIQQRADLLGGKIKIDSSDTGTVVTLKFPLNLNIK